MNIGSFAEPNFKEKKLRTDFQEEKNECWKFLNICITNIGKFYMCIDVQHLYRWQNGEKITYSSLVGISNPLNQRTIFYFFNFLFNQLILF